jgi:hypothetical protein
MFATRTEYSQNFIYVTCGSLTLCLILNALLTALRGKKDKLSEGFLKAFFNKASEPSSENLTVLYNWFVIIVTIASIFFVFSIEEVEFTDMMMCFVISIYAILGIISFIVLYSSKFESLLTIANLFSNFGNIIFIAIIIVYILDILFNRSSFESLLD